MTSESVENGGPQLQALAIAFVALTWIGVLLRAYTRAVIVKHITWDDKFIAASLVFYTLYCSFVLVGVHYGTGQHDADLSVDDMLMALRYWYYCEWAYVITMCFIKVAIAIFYLRIFIEKWQRRIVWITLITVILTGVAYLLAIVLQCLPIPFIWHRYDASSTQKGVCLPSGVVLAGTYIHSAVSAISDFTLAGLPIVLLWNVRFLFWKKFWIGVMMGLGAIAVVATLIRLRFIDSLIVKEDFLYRTFGVAIWSTVEPGIGLFAVCLSVLRPLVAKVIDTTFSARCVQTIASLGIEVSSTGQEDPYGTLGSGSRSRKSEAPLPPMRSKLDPDAAISEVLPEHSTGQSLTPESQQEPDIQVSERLSEHFPTTMNSKESAVALELDREMTNPTLLPFRVRFEGLNVPEMVLNRWSYNSWRDSKRASAKG